MRNVVSCAVLLCFRSVMGLYALTIFLGLIYGIVAPCGRSHFHPDPHTATSYIVGGTVASAGDFPWQVGIVDDGYLICGGSMVIGNDGFVKVITAAHCINKNHNVISVVFGMHNVGSQNENRRVIKAVSITVHSDYNSRTLSNDIAIISFGNLEEHGPELSVTHSHPICLANKEHAHNEPSLVSGWGTTSSGGSSSQVLQYVWKPLLSRAACEQTGNGGRLDDTMLCAGETGKDACQGDSGGPLVAYRQDDTGNDSRWELVGVVSWGFGCGDYNYPGVYANVFNLKPWILANL